MTEIAKILLVDDKKSNLLALSNLLEKEDRQIITAESGEEALRIALEIDFALIMMDVQMPGMDGYEVAAILKSNRKTQKIPLIFVTAISSEDTNVLKGFEAGAVDFLFKPLNHEITRAKVDSFIKIYKQQRLLEVQNEQLRRLNLMVENSVSGICTVNLEDMAITGFNPAFSRLTGITDQSGKTSLLKIFPEEEHANIKEQLFRLKNSSEIRTVESEYIRTDGAKGYILLNIASVETTWFISLMDITEKKVYEENLIQSYLDLEEKVKERTSELSQANKEMQEFVSAVSHDLRAPVRGISSLSQWIVEDFQNSIGQDGARNFELLKKRVEKLDRMVRAVVEYSRMGKNPVSNEQVDIPELLKEIIHDSHVPEHISIDIKSDIPKIKFNRDFLAWVFRELIENAIHFNDKEKGEIEIGCKAKADSWWFYVKDNGPGIPAKNHEDIFKVFYAFDPDDSESTSPGMGLAYVKKIISMKNGKVWVESEDKKGTTVFFSIPRESAATAILP